MGKHFSAEDSTRSWKAKGLLASEILRKLQIARRRKHMTGPNMKSVRRAQTGKSFKRTAMETRGRKVNVFAAVIGGRRLPKNGIIIVRGWSMCQPRTKIKSIL